MMSSSFGGFSEDDIIKLKNGITSVNKYPGKECQDVKANIKARKIIKVPSKIARNRNDITTKKHGDIQQIPVEARLSKIPEVSGEEDQKQNPGETKKYQECLSHNEKGQVPSEADNTDQDLQNIEQEKQLSHDKTTKKIIDLNEFQTRQKLIEEQNKKRKELLAKALADRTKQTQEESQRLNQIKHEFKKLDDGLSNDVKILRKQIEYASVDYMEAQKRYLKIEKEFLDAKLALQQKVEKKEMLTEHLCAIIEKNEERKANKLMELLQKLEVQVDIAEDNNVTTCNDKIQVPEVTSSECKVNHINS